jgi:hypothetical protein
MPGKWYYTEPNYGRLLFIKVSSAERIISEAYFKQLKALSISKYK